KLRTKRVIAHVLNDAASIRESMRSLEILCGQAGEPLFQERFNQLGPLRINDSFMRQNGIRKNIQRVEGDRQSKPETPTKINHTFSCVYSSAMLNSLGSLRAIRRRG